MQRQREEPLLPLNKAVDSSPPTARARYKRPKTRKRSSQLVSGLPTKQLQRNGIASHDLEYPCAEKNLQVGVISATRRAQGRKAAETCPVTTLASHPLSKGVGCLVRDLCEPRSSSGEANKSHSPEKNAEKIFNLEFNKPKEKTSREECTLKSADELRAILNSNCFDKDEDEDARARFAEEAGPKSRVSSNTSLSPLYFPATVAYESISRESFDLVFSSLLKFPAKSNSSISSFSYGTLSDVVSDAESFVMRHQAFLESSPLLLSTAPIGLTSPDEISPLLSNSTFSPTEPESDEPMPDIISNYRLLSGIKERQRCSASSESDIMQRARDNSQDSEHLLSSDSRSGEVAGSQIEPAKNIWTVSSCDARPTRLATAPMIPVPPMRKKRPPHHRPKCPPPSPPPTRVSSISTMGKELCSVSPVPSVIWYSSIESNASSKLVNLSQLPLSTMEDGDSRGAFLCNSPLKESNPEMWINCSTAEVILASITPNEGSDVDPLLYTSNSNRQGKAWRRFCREVSAFFKVLKSNVNLWKPKN